MSGDLMKQLDEGLRQLVRFRTVLESAGLPAGIDASASESIALRFLVNNSVSQAHLGDYLGLEKSTISRLVDSLVAKGWVSKSPAPGNGRLRIVELTPPGLAVAQHVEQAMLLAHRRMVNELTLAERDALAIALPALLRTLAQPPH